MKDREIASAGRLALLGAAALLLCVGAAASLAQDREAPRDEPRPSAETEPPQAPPNSAPRSDRDTRKRGRPAGAGSSEEVPPGTAVDFPVDI